jgi:DNA-binding NarL/FixJ family response regulator
MREETLQAFVMFTRTFTSIVLVEDHAILREGIRALIELEADLTVVGEASTGTLMASS